MYQWRNGTCDGPLSRSRIAAAAEVPNTGIICFKKIPTIGSPLSSRCQQVHARVYIEIAIDVYRQRAPRRRGAITITRSEAPSTARHTPPPPPAANQRLLTLYTAANQPAADQPASQPATRAWGGSGGDAGGARECSCSDGGCVWSGRRSLLRLRRQGSRR